MPASPRITIEGKSFGPLVTEFQITRERGIEEVAIQLRGADGGFGATLILSKRDAEGWEQGISAARMGRVARVDSPPAPEVGEGEGKLEIEAPSTAAPAAPEAPAGSTDDRPRVRVT